MYIVPGWLFGILIFGTLCLLFLILAALFEACIRPIFRRREERKEREAELDATFLPADVEYMEERYPGPIDGESLICIEGTCLSCLDGMIATITSILNSFYDRMNSRISAEEREYIQGRIFEERSLLFFLTFVETHAIDAFLTYLQNGEMFFEDKPEHTEGGDEQ